MIGARGPAGDVSTVRVGDCSQRGEQNRIAARVFDSFESNEHISSAIAVLIVDDAVSVALRKIRHLVLCAEQLLVCDSMIKS